MFTNKYFKIFQKIFKKKDPANRQHFYNFLAKIIRSKPGLERIHNDKSSFWDSENFRKQQNQSHFNDQIKH